MNVLKRNGNIEEFNKKKIYNAIMQAAIASGVQSQMQFEPTAEFITEDILKTLQAYDSDEPINIETIQNLVEIGLYYFADNTEVTKAFILFREKRRQEREKAQKYSNIIKARAISPDESDQKQNANVDEKSFSGRMYEAGEALWKETALDDFMPEDIARLHREGLLYLHDLSRWAIGQHNCLQLDLTHIFKHGLKTRQSHLRPPSRFASACQQIAVIMQIISQCQFGGISEPHLDRTLKPFVEKSRQRIRKKYPDVDDAVRQRMLYDEIKQGAEALVANLSSLQSRSGSQLPFSSINFGADNDDDALLVSQAILEAMIDGVGPSHKTPPFPILCYRVKKGINRNPEDKGYKNYLLALKCMTRRLTPNLVNLDSSVNKCDPNDPDTWLTAMGT